MAGKKPLLVEGKDGEAIVTGEAARLPVPCRITPPDGSHRPRSEDPLPSALTGAWTGGRKGKIGLWLRGGHRARSRQSLIRTSSDRLWRRTQPLNMEGPDG